MVDTSGLNTVLKNESKPINQTIAIQDHYEVGCYEDHSEEDKPIPPKKSFTIKKREMTPSDLNTQLRIKYQIPLSANRNNIAPYLEKITNENHKYFLRRYAINGKEFDVCWLLLQEGI